MGILLRGYGLLRRDFGRSDQQAGDGLNLRRTFGVLAVVLASGLCLSACGEEEEEAPPTLTEIRAFRAYPVYYSGASVAGSSITEILGDPSQYKDKRGTSWFLVYGDCDPGGEGGCLPPLQIHSYSTCTRWASLLNGSPVGIRSRLFDFRGAKATRMEGSKLEIFTGRTTVTIGAENRRILNAAVRALREVHQKHPPSSLPPPMPGSLNGDLPCQGNRAEIVDAG